MATLRMKQTYVVDGKLRKKDEEFPCPPIWGDLNVRAGRAEWVKDEAETEEEAPTPEPTPEFKRQPKNRARKG